MVINNAEREPTAQNESKLIIEDYSTINAIIILEKI